MALETDKSLSAAIKSVNEWKISIFTKEQITRNSAEEAKVVCPKVFGKYIIYFRCLVWLNFDCFYFHSKCYYVSPVTLHSHYSVTKDLPHFWAV